MLSFFLCLHYSEDIRYQIFINKRREREFRTPYILPYCLQSTYVNLCSIAHKVLGNNYATTSCSMQGLCVLLRSLVINLGRMIQYLFVQITVHCK